MSPTEDQEGGSGGVGNRRALIVVVLAALVVVLVVVGIALALGLRRGEAPEARPSASRSATVAPSPLPLTSGSPTPSPSGSPEPTPDPVYGAPVQQEVRKGQTATFSNGITARIAGLESLEAGGDQVGDVAGPAVRVTLEISNGSSSSVDASGIEVNVYLSDGTPAAALSSNADSRASGELAPGQSGTGRWEFSVPRGSQASIMVTVSEPGSPALIVFS